MQLRQNFIQSFETRYGAVERQQLSPQAAQSELDHELKRIDRIKPGVDIYNSGGGMFPPTRMQGLVENNLYQGADHIHITSVSTPSLTTTYLGEIDDAMLVRHQLTSGLGDVRRETLVIDRQNLGNSYRQTEVFPPTHEAPVQAARALDQAHFAPPTFQVDGWMSLNIPGC